jgi:hypothetical protein
MATGGDGLGLASAAVTQDTLGVIDLDALIAFVQQQPGGVVKGDAAPRLIPASR